MVDCGKLKHFLGIKIKTKNELMLRIKFVKILVKFGVEDCNSNETPKEKELATPEKYYKFTNS